MLANGLLHYYRNKGEMSRTCRGSISLHGAHIITEDSCNFIVSNAGGTQTYHLRAASEVERQKWVTALELAKTRAIQRMSSDDMMIGDIEGSGVTGAGAGAGAGSGVGATSGAAGTDELLRYGMISFHFFIFLHHSTKRLQTAKHFVDYYFLISSSNK